MNLVVTVDHSADAGLEVGIEVTLTVLDIGGKETRQLRSGCSQNLKDFAGLKKMFRNEAKSQLNVVNEG
jgi:hypothetical protein